MGGILCTVYLKLNFNLKTNKLKYFFKASDIKEFVILILAPVYSHF